MALQHIRSHSFPSASKPAIIHVDGSLLSETTPSSFSSFVDGMERLEDLYESIDDLLMLPHTQQIIFDDCISLSDACTSVKDIISIVKEDLRELLSALRRKDAAGISAYLASRRNSKKMIQKSMEKLKRGASAISAEEMSVERSRICCLLPTRVSIVIRVGSENARNEEQQLVISIKADALKESIG